MLASLLCIFLINACSVFLSCAAKERLSGSAVSERNEYMLSAREARVARVFVSRAEGEANLKRARHGSSQVHCSFVSRS